MAKVLERLNITRFYDKDLYSEDIIPNARWQTRARKLRNRKWRELNRKISNDQSIAY